MVAKVELNFEKTRHVKNNDKSKNIFYVVKEMQDIIMEFYLLSKVTCDNCATLKAQSCASLEELFCWYIVLYPLPQSLRKTPK